MFHDGNFSAMNSGASKTAIFSGQVPSTWSVFRGGEVQPAKNLTELTSADSLLASIAPHEIDFGDGAFEQVDFYLLGKNATQELLDEATKGGYKMTHETIGGVPATAIHYPTDHGQIDKDGSGGTDYILLGSEKNQNADSNLLMRDWSKGSPEFEQGFQGFLQNANFAKGWY